MHRTSQTIVKGFEKEWKTDKLKACLYIHMHQLTCTCMYIPCLHRNVIHWSSHLHLKYTHVILCYTPFKNIFQCLHLNVPLDITRKSGYGCTLSKKTFHFIKHRHAWTVWTYSVVAFYGSSGVHWCQAIIPGMKEKLAALLQSYDHTKKRTEINFRFGVKESQYSFVYKWLIYIVCRLNDWFTSSRTLDC